MNNTRWTLSAAALCVMALSAYGCSSDPATSDDDADDDTTSSSSGKAASSSSGKAASSSSGGKSSSSSGGSSGSSTSSGGSSGSTSSSGGSSSSSGDAGASSSGGSDGGSGGLAACYDAADASTWNGVGASPSQGKALNLCTAAQRDKLLNCSGFVAAPAADCDAWLADAANSTCIDCVFPGDDQYPGLFYTVDGDEDNIYLTTICSANAANNAAECGSKAMDQSACSGSVCGGCGTQAEFDACTDSVNDAAVSACSAYKPAVDCAAAFTTAAAAIKTSCGDPATDTLTVVWNKRVNYICGNGTP